jgi:hypothetical protein
MCRVYESRGSGIACGSDYSLPLTFTRLRYGRGFTSSDAPASASTRRRVVAVDSGEPTAAPVHRLSTCTGLWQCAPAGACTTTTSPTHAELSAANTEPPALAACVCSARALASARSSGAGGVELCVTARLASHAWDTRLGVWTRHA